MRVVVVAGVIVGSVERLVIWRSKIAALDGDEAVWGLMARHALHGQFSAFMWGQAYGGTLETLLSAPLLGLFPGHVVALRFVPLALTAVAAVLVWRVGRRTVGEPARPRQPCIFWIWPSYAIWKSMRAHGFYGSGLVAALLVLLLLLRLDERATRRDAAFLGIVVGVGLWQSAQLLPIALVGTLWLVWRRPATLRLAPLALAFAFVGFLPWLISNLEHDWWSFSFPPGAGTATSRLRGILDGALPMLFGLRIPFDLAWVGGIAIGGTAMLALYVAFVVVAVRRGKSTVGLLVAVARDLPPDRRNVDVHVDRGRASLSLHRLAGLRAPRLPRPHVMATRRCGDPPADGCHDHRSPRGWTSSPRFAERADGMFVPADFGPLIAELDRLHVDRAFADYWVAYRLDFETDERIVAAESPQERYARVGRKVVVLDNDHVRYPPYVEEVDRSAAPAHVVLTGSLDESNLDVQLLRAAGYRKAEAGGFTIWYLPRTVPR